MASPKSVSLTSVAVSPQPGLAPEPYGVVGGLPAATTALPGGVKKAPAQANSTATDVAGLVTDFNALLLKLRNAGFLS